MSVLSNIFISVSDAAIIFGFIGDITSTNEKQRDKFYGSLTSPVISIPGPMCLVIEWLRTADVAIQLVRNDSSRSFSVLNEKQLSVFGDKKFTEDSISVNHPFDTLPFRLQLEVKSDGKGPLLGVAVRRLSLKSGLCRTMGMLQDWCTFMYASGSCHNVVL